MLILPADFIALLNVLASRAEAPAARKTQRARTAQECAKKRTHRRDSCLPPPVPLEAWGSCLGPLHGPPARGSGPGLWSCAVGVSPPDRWSAGDWCEEGA